jgi:hypothetical protein
MLITYYSLVDHGHKLDSIDEAVVAVVICSPVAVRVQEYRFQLTLGAANLPLLVSLKPTD